MITGKCERTHKLNKIKKHVLLKKKHHLCPPGAYAIISQPDKNLHHGKNATLFLKQYRWCLGNQILLRKWPETCSSCTSALISQLLPFLACCLITGGPLCLWNLRGWQHKWKMNQKHKLPFFPKRESVHRVLSIWQHSMLLVGFCQ